MKEIQLTKGKIALVDDEDFDRINNYKWQSHLRFNYYYASRKSSRLLGKRKTIYMHREILNINDPNIHIDHISHDGLNNQKSNLRICTSSQNHANQKKHTNCSSIFKGVHWNTKKKRWISVLFMDRKVVHYKTFKCELLAGLSYDDAIKKHHGSFACTNF